MNNSPDILCIGSVLWDVIGRSTRDMRVGSDVPGRIRRLPGGVAMNIAMTLRTFGMTPAILTAIGQDREGEELIAEALTMGLMCDYVYRSEDLPTDVYMAIEGASGLIAAIADAHSLEAAGDKILAPLANGDLGDKHSPYDGTIALDGNLTVALLENIASSPLFANADLRVAPASPGKAERLLALMGHPSATLYVNLEEAGLLCGTTFADSESAACGLVARGASRALVTDGAAAASDANDAEVITQTPPTVVVSRVTGAGDTFMAAHIASDVQGLDRQTSLSRALQAAATFVSGETPQ